jgi:hypothetical protein
MLEQAIEHYEANTSMIYDETSFIIIERMQPKK